MEDESIYTELDRVIRVMALLPVGKYPVKPSQEQKLKMAWEALHKFDAEHDYTFTEDFKYIKKRRKAL